MYEELKKLAEGMKGWDKMTECWPCDENGPDWKVGRLDEDENRWPLLTIDTAEYDQEQDAPKIAQYYAAANPSAVLALIANLEKIDADRKACWAEFKVQGSYIRELQAENNELIADGESNSSQLSDVLAERDRLQLVLFDRNAEIEALRKECARLAEDNRSMLENPEDLL